MPYELITILGPTATGKTALAARLAHDLQTAVISADSRQIYRGMDIGTGKDLSEYIIDGQPVPYYLIDICEAGEKYNLFRYQKDFFEVFNSLRAKGKTPILCGGTGLYIESILKGYNLTDPTGTTPSPYPSVNSLIIGIGIDRQLRREKITARLRARLEEGMIGEVKRLLDSGIPPKDIIYYGLEYKYLTLFLLGELNYSELFNQLEIAIHQFAKRQMTWFRGMERRGFTIHWIDATLPLNDKIGLIKNLLD